MTFKPTELEITGEIWSRDTDMEIINRKSTAQPPRETMKKERRITDCDTQKYLRRIREKDVTKAPEKEQQVRWRAIEKSDPY